MALACMTVDHLAASGILGIPYISFFYSLLRGIGRIAFPLYAFLLVEGFIHTHSVRRYIFRLFIMGIICEVPYDMAIFGKVFDFRIQNICFTLMLCLVMLYCIDTLVMKGYHREIWIPVLLGIIIGYSLKLDYGVSGVILVLVLYLFRNRHLFRGLGVAFIYMSSPMGILSVVPMELYDENRKNEYKYLFYVYYPLHLAVIGCVRLLLSTWT